jgi:hypothetical protein
MRGKGHPKGQSNKTKGEKVNYPTPHLLIVGDNRIVEYYSIYTEYINLRKYFSRSF